MAQVGPSLDALAHEADTLGVADRRGVEAVTRQLEPVKAQLEDEVALGEPRTLVGNATAPEAGMNAANESAAMAAALAKRMRIRNLEPRCCELEDPLLHRATGQEKGKITSRFPVAS